MLKIKLLKNFSWPLKIATQEIEITRLYPEKMMELPAAERGIHELDATTCIGCSSISNSGTLSRTKRCSFRKLTLADACSAGYAWTSAQWNA